MSIRVRCDDTQSNAYLEFDTIADFYRYDRELKPKKVNHIINGFIIQIDTRIRYMDEYESGTMQWYVVGGKFMNYYEPFIHHPLEDYLPH